MGSVLVLFDFFNEGEGEGLRSQRQLTHIKNHRALSFFRGAKGGDAWN